MKYWLIVGIKDRKFCPYILQKIRSFETPPDAEVSTLVVETGEAVGCWDRESGDTILQCNEAGVVPFLNMALTWLKEHAGPEDWFVRIDADDYYGPEYLLEVQRSKLLGRVCSGLPACYVWTEEDKLYFCQGLNSANAGVPGGTLAGNIERAEFFRSRNAWGEDGNWCQDMSEIGYQVGTRAPTHYAMRRWPGHAHTFPIRGEELPHVWLCDAQYLGDWEESKVLRGETQGTFVEPSPELALAHYRRALEALT